MKQGGGTGGNVDGGDDDEMQVVDGDRGGAGRKPGGGVGKDKAVGKDDELKIVGSEGQFVLMDCAHSRDTCVTFPFGGDDKARRVRTAGALCARCPGRSATRGPHTATPVTLTPSGAWSETTC